MNEPKEIDVFNRHERFQKLKTIGIAVLIAIVALAALYFFVKALLTYTVEYNLNGGYVYNTTLEPAKLKFLQRVEEPKGVKKEGYYIEYWSRDKNLGSKFRFGSPIWNSMTLNVKWADGVAIQLRFAQGEENSDLPLKDLKGLYEQYIKPGSDWTIPLVYNKNEQSVHYGEQLLWYDNPECTGEPFAVKSWKNLTENVTIYGKWFDTDPEKFQVDEEGTLQRYLGYCNKVILPSGIKKIKDIDPEKFTTGSSDQLNEQDGEYHSVWQNVMANGVNGMNIIYLNPELEIIGDCAFKDCESLEIIKFMGNNVNSIGEWSFANCEKLREFTFPTLVTRVPAHCFDGAFKLFADVSLILDNVTYIEEEAFVNANIYSITLNKVEFIGSKAFAACYDLHDVVINNNKVVTSNVTGGYTPGGLPNDKGIFFGTYSYSEFNQKLKIYVPANLYEEYLALDYWAMYSIEGNNALHKIES